MQQKYNALQFIMPVEWWYSYKYKTTYI